MREAMRASGEAGRKRIEDNELRRQRHNEMTQAAAEGERDTAGDDTVRQRVGDFLETHDDAQDVVGGEDLAGGGVSPKPQTHRIDEFGKFDDDAENEAVEPAPTSPAAAEADEGSVCSPTEIADSPGRDVEMGVTEI